MRGQHLPEIINHDEDGCRPDESLLHAEEDVGDSDGPPVFGENDHQGHRNGAAPAQDHGPLAAQRVARDARDEVEDSLHNAEEHEVGSGEYELFGDEVEHLGLLLAVGLGFDPAVRRVREAAGRVSARERSVRRAEHLLFARRLVGNPRHGEREKLHTETKTGTEWSERVQGSLAIALHTA